MSDKPPNYKSRAEAKDYAASLILSGQPYDLMIVADAIRLYRGSCARGYADELPGAPTLKGLSELEELEQRFRDAFKAFRDSKEGFVLERNEWGEATVMAP